MDDKVDFFALLPSFVVAEIMSILVDEAMNAIWRESLPLKCLSAVVRFGATSQRNRCIITELQNGAGVVWRLFDMGRFDMFHPRSRPTVPRFVLQNATRNMYGASMDSLPLRAKLQPSLTHLDVVWTRATDPITPAETARLFLPLRELQLEHLSIVCETAGRNQLVEVQLPPSLNRLCTNFSDGLLSSCNAWPNLRYLELAVMNGERVKFPPMPNLQLLKFRSLGSYTVDWGSCPLITDLVLTYYNPASMFDGIESAPCRHTLASVTGADMPISMLRQLRMCTNLQSLELGGVYDLSEVAQLAGMSKYIKYIIMDTTKECNLPAITPCLARVGQVRSLALKHNYYADEDQIAAVFEAGCCSTVECLRLNLVTNRHGRVFNSHVPVQAFKDNIAKGLRVLCVLDMAPLTCLDSKVYRETVASLVNACPHLVELSLGPGYFNMHKFTEATADAIAKVECLSLNGDMDLWMDTSTEWLTAWKSLHVIRICVFESEHGKAWIASLGVNCPNLRQVHNKFGSGKDVGLPKDVIYM